MEKQTVRDRIELFLKDRGSALVHEIVTGASVPKTNVHKELHKLRGEGRVYRRESDGRWVIGDKRIWRYPNIPAHCLGRRSYGFFG